MVLDERRQRQVVCNWALLINEATNMIDWFYVGLDITVFIIYVMEVLINDWYFNDKSLRCYGYDNRHQIGEMLIND